MLLEALTAVRYLRCVLLLGLAAGMYSLVRLLAGWDYAHQPYWGWGAEYGPLVMNYRQTYGVSPWPYLLLLGLVILLPVAFGWLRPAGRWTVVVLPILLLGVFLLRRALPENVRLIFRPVSTAVFSHDARYAAALFVGHLSPPLNMRMLLNTYPSNVLFAGPRQLVEPPYPDYPEVGAEPARTAFASDAAFQLAQQDFAARQAQAETDYEARRKDYETAEAAYSAEQAKAPRIALWVMAGLYPLLLPLWTVAGLALGSRLRGEPARDG
jgi:hypothetical protein